MGIHVYKGHVIEITTIDRYSDTKYVGDVYHDGDLITTHADPSEAGVLSICVTYIDNLGDDKNE